ncbi:membrane peptidoglycan carboxypeptidase [Friedmanniella endophytica]|uniref:Membrane peptidoglycan carboxypeptidase n=1 Tax=Microlunatus kandeliicorticis TaxID=1759536 RepID=A0A7W3IR71_9ACTN|nr:transglycosylase domain-containing protein [Microlunatus kandeliicorticis]MBA8793747.1 membrane peptidoglycan carboxypeptidase [Microlunatus kandeliicorticis]
MAEPTTGGKTPRRGSGAPASGSAKPGKRKPKRTRGQKVGRFFGITALVVAICMVLGFGALAVGYLRTEVPDPNKAFTTNTTFVYYDDGKTQLSSLAIQNRQSISYDEMPASIKEAIVAAENRTFWTDPGISISGMARAALNIARGGSLQGGSTITQQYIKVLYLTENQTVSRKIKEIFLAAKLGRSVPKQDILRDYLNTIYFGHGAYGIQAASKAYFGIDAKKLSVPQAAVLASVINNPSLFDPDDPDNRPRLLDRYRYVLDGMRQAGNITPAQEAQYAKALPKFPKIKTPERYGGPQGFLLKAVEDELGTIGLDESQVQGGGYKIVTTFDKKSEDAAVEAAQKYTKIAAGNAGRKTSTLHAAVASVDVSTGAVRAMYGGPNYIDNSRNWATTHRPTASTFKAFTLAAGLENGFSLRSTFHGNTWYLPGDPIPVRNENNDQYGYAVNLIRATALSINTAFVDLITQLKDGRAAVEKVAEDAGAPKTTGWDAAERNVPIGTPEVSPLNLASAYATFANGGVHVPVHVIKAIYDHNGNLVYKADPKTNRAVSKDVAADTTYALSSVVDQGTGRVVQALGRPVAGKTGTNGVDTPGQGNIVNSSWFVGYTRQISTAVMYVAGNSGSASLDPYRQPGDTTFYGATYPARTWLDYMQVATQGQSIEKFPDPAWVNTDGPPPATSAPPTSATPTPSKTPSSTPTPSATPSETPSAPASSASAPESSRTPEPPAPSSSSSSSSGSPEPPGRGRNGENATGTSSAAGPAGSTSGNG